MKLLLFDVCLSFHRARLLSAFWSLAVRVAARRAARFEALLHDRRRADHVLFGALSVAVACGFAPLWFSIPVVVIAAFILMHVAEKSRVSADAMIAVFIGVIVTSLTTGMTTDVDSYMFGSILAMSRSDVILASRSRSACSRSTFSSTTSSSPSVTFDERDGRARRHVQDDPVRSNGAHRRALGMRMMLMLLSSLIIFPALSAMRVFKSFRSVVCFAAGLSVMCFCLGLTGSYLLHPRGCDGRRLRPCGVSPA